MAKRHEEWWARYLRQPSEQRSIAPVLGLTFLAMLSIPILTDHTWGKSVEVGLVGLSAIVALNRTGAHGSLRRIAVVIVVITTALAAVAPNITALQDGPVTEVAAALFILLLMITPVVILLRLLLRPKITVDTLAGSLAAYLQIGIFFGALFSFVQLVSNEQFFAQKVPPGSMSFQYFSFITMTTVGYGDLTPATPWGQTLATMEAVVGQVFLVTVVALTVSNLGRSLSHRRGISGDEGDDGVEASTELGALDPQADAR
jgi:hypothetical protein